MKERSEAIAHLFTTYPTWTVQSSERTLQVRGRSVTLNNGRIHHNVELWHPKDTKPYYDMLKTSSSELINRFYAPFRNSRHLYALVKNTNLIC